MNEKYEKTIDQVVSDWFNKIVQIDQVVEYDDIDELINMLEDRETEVSRND
ncbi:MAG: hypothetical protein GY853_00975 [PVC group bacterium]|nr:hypothetical protein [PVC group bacterium]